MIGRRDERRTGGSRPAPSRLEYHDNRRKNTRGAEIGKLFEAVR